MVPAMNILVDKMQPDDWPEVCAIFTESLAFPFATFESEVPDWESWNASRLQSCRLIARRDTDVFGWATLSSAPST